MSLCQYLEIKSLEVEDSAQQHAAFLVYMDLTAGMIMLWGFFFVGHMTFEPNLSRHHFQNDYVVSVVAILFTNYKNVDECFCL